MIKHNGRCQEQKKTTSAQYIVTLCQTSRANKSRWKWTAPFKKTRCEIFLLQEFLRGCGCWLFLVPDKKTGHKFPFMHPTFPLSFALFNPSICPHLHRNYLPISPLSEGVWRGFASNEAASSQPGNTRWPPPSLSQNNRTGSRTTSDCVCELCATGPRWSRCVRTARDIFVKPGNKTLMLLFKSGKKRPASSQALILIFTQVPQPRHLPHKNNGPTDANYS